jgi:multisubunit Na+/H+ antiporter MnhF subunit
MILMINGEVLDYIISAAQSGVASVGEALASIHGIGAVETLKALTTMEAVAGNATAMNAVASNTTATNAVASSAAAMNVVANSGTAMNVVTASTTAMNIIASNETAMNVVASSTTAMNVVANSETAMNIIASNETAMNAVASSTTAMNVVLSNETAMNTVANSETAMNIIASNETAMNVVAANTTAMNVVASSAVALNAICKTSIARSAFIDSRYRDTYYNTILTTLTNGTDYFKCVENKSSLHNSDDEYYYNGSTPAGSTIASTADACFFILSYANRYSQYREPHIYALENNKMIVASGSSVSNKVVPGGVEAYYIGDSSTYYLFKAI